MANVQYRGTGRRKSSVARVILTPGTGKCEINGKAAKEYLPSDVLLMIVDQPLELTGTKDKFDAGLLTRDSRVKERKKYGLKKARRAPQFSKR